MDKDSLRSWLENGLGIRPSEGDLTALSAELATLESSLERWRRMELKDMDPCFLVRDRVPPKGKTP